LKDCGESKTCVDELKNNPKFHKIKSSHGKIQIPELANYSLTSYRFILPIPFYFYFFGLFLPKMYWYFEKFWKKLNLLRVEK